VGEYCTLTPLLRPTLRRTASCILVHLLNHEDSWRARSTRELVWAHVDPVQIVAREIDLNVRALKQFNVWKEREGG
jgi:hypothetical protein